MQDETCFQKSKSTVGLKNRNDSRSGGGFVATFGINNTPIYRAKCKFLVQGGTFDTGSCPIVVDDWY